MYSPRMSHLVVVECLSLPALAATVLAAPGEVLSHQKISDTEGGFVGVLNNGAHFGSSTAFLGDLDGDGVPDIAIGEHHDQEGGLNRGAVWVCFLNTDGTVKDRQKISNFQGNFNGVLDDDDRFGISAAAIGDLDGDGVIDMAVGSLNDDDGAMDVGAVWILFMNTDGTVKSHQKISDTAGNFTGTLINNERFGVNTAFLGDFDNDGVGELAVGAWGSSDGGEFRGAVWILFLNSDGTVKSHQKISDLEGNFTGVLADDDRFGISTAAISDVDGDGVCDLAVGAVHDGDGGLERGAVWILFLNPDGTVKSHQKISQTQGNFTGALDNNDEFGRSVLSFGDLNGDGRHDLAVGAVHDDDGGFNHGAVWMLFLDGVCIWDLDADGLIGIIDFLALLAAWGNNPCGPPDFDGDGNVGITDLLQLLANWGPCPEP